MAAEGGHGASDSGAYIQHHLQNLQVCKAETGEWLWNDCAGNFWAMNVDSMFWSVLLGLIFVLVFRGTAKSGAQLRNRVANSRSRSAGSLAPPGTRPDR